MGSCYIWDLGHRKTQLDRRKASKTSDWVNYLLHMWYVVCVFRWLHAQSKMVEEREREREREGDRWR